MPSHIGEIAMMAHARPQRIECSPVLGHGTSRDNALQRIVKSDVDRQAWLRGQGQVFELIRLSEVW